MYILLNAYYGETMQISSYLVPKVCFLLCAYLVLYK